MRTNIQNDVKVESGLIHTSKFNRSGLVSTSTNIGLVTPTKCFAMQPNSKEVIKSSELIRLAAMVSPTYSKQKLKNWYIFVPIEDVNPNYPWMMTGKGGPRGDNLYVYPENVPYSRRWKLSSFALQGSVATLYANTAGLFANTNCKQWKTASWAESELPDTPPTFWNNILNEFDYQFTDGNAEGRKELNIQKLLGRSEGLDDLWVTLANRTKESFGVPIPKNLSEMQSGLDDYDTTPVSMESADVKVYFSLTYEVEDPETHETSEETVECCLAFRLSTWGIQCHKTLCGLGYGFDLMDNNPVEIDRLWAYYRAYWRVFGLERYTNWENTFVNEQVQEYSQLDDPELENGALYNLFDEVGCLWVTENLDYISAHTFSPTNATMTQSLTLGANPLVDVQSDSSYAQPWNHVTVPNRANPNVSASDPIDYMTLGDGDSHSFTWQIFHGFLDSEIMRRMYKLANTESLLGHSVYKLMTAMGLGEYVKRTRDNFVGYTETPIEVQTVTATSDTYKDGEGKMLGQYVGKGIGSKEHKTIKFKSDTFGYLFCLQAITCDSGYCQGIDETISAVKEYQQYHNIADGLGQELAPMSILMGQMDIAVSERLREGEAVTGIKGYDGVASPANISFGYRPRNSGFKVGRNVLMGGFALPSMRKNFITYNQDKLLYPEQRIVARLADGKFIPYTGNDNTIAYDEVRTMPIGEIPKAGDAWRYLGRYPWLGNLLRIFAQSGDESKKWFKTIFTESMIGDDWEKTFRIDDNYMVFQEFIHSDWAPMEPIANTYGTIDPSERENNFTERV